MTAIEVIGIVIGVIFVMHSVIFISQPTAAREELLRSPLTLPQLRLLGIAELAGGIVLIVAPFIDLPGWLVAAAALGIAGVGLPATFLHIGRREFPQAAFTTALTIGGVVVAISNLT